MHPSYRKELHTRARTFAPQSAARASFVRDVDRIEKYLAAELRPSTNGLALFSCAGAENFFEAVQLTVRHFTVTAGKHRDLEAEFPDAAAHAVHDRVVLPRVASVKDQPLVYSLLVVLLFAAL